jgi:XTP/dITP diphosphohydrolase
MKELAIVTSNQGKMQEFKAGLEPMGYKVTQLDVDCDEIQTDTLEEVVKSCVAQVELMGYNDFILDDSGLFLNNYNGFPGVYSSYVFKTIGCKGILKLLDREPERSARFECVIGCSIQDVGRIFVSGSCPGWIDFNERGKEGFGFDPIFVPDGASKSFAEMSMEEKNKVSHRGIAMKQLEEQLKWRMGDR